MGDAVPGDSDLVEQGEHTGIEVAPELLEEVGEPLGVGNFNAEPRGRPLGQQLAELAQFDEGRTRVRREVALGQRAEPVERGVALRREREVPRMRVHAPAPARLATGTLALRFASGGATNPARSVGASRPCSPASGINLAV